MSGLSESTEDSPLQKPSLLDLPFEILQRMVDELTQVDMVSFLRACRRTYDLTLPALYRIVHTKRETTNDVSSFADFFMARPHLVSFVRRLNIDELDPAGIRRLLTISFPNLTKLVIRHVGPVRKVITEDEKITLNQSIKQQPRLEDFTFYTKTGDDDRQYSLTINDYPLFNHPTLTNLCCKRLGFLGWKDLPVSTFTHAHLDTLCLIHCIISPHTIKLFTSPAKNLSHLRLWRGWQPYYGFFSELIDFQVPCFQALKVLKLHTRKGNRTRVGPSLKQLTSLLFLEIQIDVFLGSSYQALDDRDTNSIESVLKGHLPPNLKVLCLEGLYSKYRPGPLPKDFHPNTIVTHHSNGTVSTRTPRGLLDPLDKSIIKTLVARRDSLCPSLSVIYTKPQFLNRQSNEAIDPDTDELLHLAEVIGIDVLRIWQGTQDALGFPRVDWIEDQRAPMWVEADGTAVHGMKRVRTGGAHGKKYCWCYLDWKAWDGKSQTCWFED